MFITKKHISRRAVLQGAGVSLALPLLDSMIPAQTRVAQAPAKLACLEMVHGAAGSTVEGGNKHYWSPAKVGRDFEITQTLASLEPFKDYLTIISHTDLDPAGSLTPVEEGGDHFRSTAAFLTAGHARMTEGSDIFVGTSIDQIYASQFGQDTPLPSMQLCIEAIDGSGACDYGYSCVYSDTISWATPKTPLPMERDPRKVFEMLFGDGATPAQRAARQKENASILDMVARSAARLQKGLPAPDRSRLNAYLEDVREIERRIQKVEKFNASGEARTLPNAPVGVPDSFEEHTNLMFDLQVLAFQTGVTRVAAFKMSRDVCQRVFTESGVKTAFHSCSHHAENPEKVAEYARLNQYHVSRVAYFLEKLKNTPDGDGNLLDHTLVLYGSPMGDSNVHNHKRLPLFLAGKANGNVQGNTHVMTPDGTPMANVLLTMMRRLGVNMDKIGDSTGELSI